MTLISVLTGLEPKIAQTLRPSDLNDIVSAVSYIKTTDHNQHLFVTQTNHYSQKMFLFELKGHKINQCLTKSREFQNNSYSNPIFSNTRPNSLRVKWNQHNVKRHYQQTSNLQQTLGFQVVNLDQILITDRIQTFSNNNKGSTISTIDFQYLF